MAGVAPTGPGSSARLLHTVEALVLVAVAMVLPSARRREAGVGVAGILFGVLTVARRSTLSLPGDQPLVNPVRDWVTGGLRHHPVSALRLADVVWARSPSALRAHRHHHRVDETSSPPWPPTAPAAPFAASLVSPSSGGCARACRCSSSRERRSPGPAPAGLAAAGARRRSGSATGMSSCGGEARPGRPAAASPPRTADRIARQGRHHHLHQENYRAGRRRGTSMFAGVDAALARAPALARARGSSRKRLAHLHNLGGISWLAHSTLESGAVELHDRPAVLTELIGSRQHPERCLRGRTVAHRRRRPLDSPFLAAGETLPATTSSTAKRRLQRLAAPRCPRPVRPDAFQADKRRPGHKPVMAEIDLVSSRIALSRCAWCRGTRSATARSRPAARRKPVRGHGLAQPELSAEVLRPVDQVRAPPSPSGSPRPTTRTTWC